MSEAKQRRQYTEEFKTEAVRLLSDSGKPVAQVARELGIAANPLYRWRRALLRRLLANWTTSAPDGTLFMKLARTQASS